MLQLEKRFDKRNLEDANYENDLNDTELLLKPSQYGTLQSPKHEPIINTQTTSLSQKIIALLRSECVLSAIVIIFGVAATFTSTFYNILDIKGLNEFWSPCIQNISLSYQLIPK
jgi:hypothetical protein